MTKAQEAVVVRAVNRAKKSQFQVTAVKVELEANLRRREGGDFSNVTDCHDYLMAKLATLGLAEFREDEWITLGHGVETEWHPIWPLTYAEFYFDGSVDSEFTFTLMLDTPRNVFLLPKIVKAFNSLAKEVGNGVDVRGAGMHMAWINSNNGVYPTRGTSADESRFYNYRKSMRMLLPALYFLGTGHEQTRGLGFRRPDVSSGSHRTAIDYRGGALEFRVFDTCYDKPNQILDNIVVMANSMKYWKSSFVSSGVEKITSRVKFGVDSSNRLDRFYVTYTHLDLLNFGLERLKPSYRTISQLKKQRKFTTDKRSLRKSKKEQERAAEAEYQEYADRFEFNVDANRMYLLLTGATESSIAERLDEERKRKKSLRQYVSDKLKQLENACGEYTLSAE
jgi:hypothetical protein